MPYPHSQNIYENLTGIIESGLIVLNSDHKIVSWNQWMQERSGIAEPHARGKTLASVFGGHLPSYLLATLDNAIDRGMSAFLSYRLHGVILPLYDRAGHGRVDEYLPQNVIVRPMGTKPRYCVVQVIDITRILAREKSLRNQAFELQAREAFLSTLMDNALEGVITIDTEGRVNSFNPAAGRMFGYAAEDIVGRKAALLIQGPHADAGEDYIEHYVMNGHGEAIVGSREVSGRRRDGSTFPIMLSIVRMQNNGRELFVGSVRDITEQKRAEENIRFMAHHDALTGLPNRVLFQDRLEYILASAERNQRLGAVMFLDLDRFKAVNDTLGHYTGDLLLQAVAERLKACTRDSDTVARLGGDEFAVIQTDVEGVDGVEVLADKIIRAVGRPYELNGETIHSSVSLGVALFPLDGSDYEQLLTYADIAMYASKAAGRGRYHFYASAMQKDVQARRDLERDLRVALREGQLELHYQPQVDLDQLKVCGVEALIRWRHPRRGLVLPGEFISVAEDSGLIIELGEWVLAEAFRQISEWQRNGICDLRMAVNLSAVQFENEQLVSFIEELLESTGIRPELIELEITETMLMKNAVESVDQLRRLHQLGVRLSIDDFGTGYSSLSYLKRFSVSTIKVDRSFVRDIGSDGDNEAIVRAVVGLGHSLGLKVTGEGVESVEQLRYLKRLKCDNVQGYYFSRPLVAEALPSFVKGFQRFARSDNAG